jgi:hypothetical protein
MPKLKVRKGKIPIRTLRDLEAVALKEFQQLKKQLQDLLDQIILNAPPTIEQGEVLTSRLGKAISPVEQRLQQRQLDYERRKRFGAPLEAAALQGRTYELESYLEPLASLARSMTLEEWESAHLFESREEVEARERKENADARRISHYLKNVGQGMEGDKEYSRVCSVADAAAAYYERVHDRWLAKRSALYLARSQSQALAVADQKSFQVPSPKLLWTMSR